MRRPVPLIAILAAALLAAGPAQGASTVTSGPAAARSAVQAKAAKAKKTTKAKAKKKAQAKKRCTTRTVRTASGRKHTVKRCRTVKKTSPKKSTPATQTPTPSSRTPATTPVGASTPAPTGLAGQVRDCANSERAKAGLSALADDPALDRAALNHANDMSARNYFAHESPEGTLPWDRIEAALLGEEPFVWMGENLALGYADGSAACVGWMNSPGHRANILNPHYDTIGTAWVGGYAVQEFGGRTY